MATVTFDGQSFILDSKRIWIVGGQIDYARTPHDQWADRLHAARVAGLNTVATSVPWALHEPRAGQFDFEGQHDIRRFVKLAGQAGLWVIVRAGPYIGEGWDMGGLPHWLAQKDDLKLRGPNAPLLEACSRYITALTEQLRDLQITSAGEGGPILAIQNEARWNCGDDAAAVGYLGELARYFREAGFNVPSINANNLWQGVEGEIDGWVGGEDMLATLRQLTAVNPDRPRIIVQMRTAHERTVGGPAADQPSPVMLQRRLAEVLAGGGQYVMAPFAGGRTPGFYAGRPDGRADAFGSSVRGLDAPVSDAGAPGETFRLVRRVSTFASQFAKIFTALDQDYRPVVLDQRAPTGTSDSTSVVDLVGTQGGVTFVFGEEPKPGAKPPRPRDVDLMLGDGSSLTVPLGKQAVAWPMFDVLLGSRAKLDHCTLNALLLVGNVFVCYGPSGASGSVSINGSPLTAIVPKGKQPSVIQHEGYTVVVASEEQADTIHAAEDGVYLGVERVDASGVPVALPGVKSCQRIPRDGGKPEKVTFQETVAASAATASIALDGWETLIASDYVLGESPRFAAIDGPEDLSRLGAPFGYGWYRVQLRSSSARKPKVLAPLSRDRLHLFLDGERVGILGYGPGATTEPMALPLKKGEHTLTVLAENLGRPSAGLELNEPKGMVDHLYEVKPFRAGRHKIESGSRVELLGFQSPLWNVRPGDQTHPDRVTWSFTHRKKNPLIITIEDLTSRVLVLINDEPHRFIDTAGPVRFVLDQQTLSRGSNTLQLAVLTDAMDPSEELASLASSVSILEGTEELTGKAKWSYAKWEPPAPSSFEEVSKTKLTTATGPTWYRVGFELAPSPTPVRVDLTGLSKGQLFLNGTHIGRYFLQAGRGAVSGLESEMLLPPALLSADGENELLIFDEMGANPVKTRLLVERGVRPILA
ncbi:MAG: beta-galactosidase [Planctomycetota bacterium]